MQNICSQFYSRAVKLPTYRLGNRATIFSNWSKESSWVGSPNREGKAFYLRKKSKRGGKSNMGIV
jgi:hypothetical protein